MEFKNLQKEDKKIAGILKKEIERQKETIDLIASENVASLAVLEALGSPLVNKYSEGYPGKRYYPGNVFYDEIELVAQERALQVFGLLEEGMSHSAKASRDTLTALERSKWGVNVQPYSGSPANLEAYLALAKPGDTIMGMALQFGGHLTHGHKVSATGKIFNSVQYGLTEKG